MTRGVSHVNEFCHYPSAALQSPIRWIPGSQAELHRPGREASVLSTPYQYVWERTPLQVMELSLKPQNPEHLALEEASVRVHPADCHKHTLVQ